MRKSSLVFLIFILFAIPAVACETSYSLVFSPESLPEAHVGKPYTVIITLSNQHTPAFSMDMPPDNLPAGLTGTFDEEKQTYTIAGIPLQAGVYSARLSAVCYGTNVSGQTGEKDYQIVVK
jgi:hypothetical protein